MKEARLARLAGRDRLAPKAHRVNQGRKGQPVLPVSAANPGRKVPQDRQVRRVRPDLRGIRVLP